jgi:predicted transcriptional regulator
MSDETLNAILRELEMLRKLKIFELSKQGYSQTQLAEALGVSQPTISRMLPKKGAKKKASDE